MDYLYTALKFIAAGSIIVGVTLLAQQADPRYGGILAAAPVTTTLAFLFTYAEAGGGTTRELVLGSLFFAIPTLLFLAALWMLMGRFSLPQSLAGAFPVWAVGVIVVTRLIGLLQPACPA